ncbi:MAG: hypothetical protein GY798_31695, partial [Hyphomicrobiales bacterium]|nr:hypothetical protein [Hyphomicrobiales bacterium]
DIKALTDVAKILSEQTNTAIKDWKEEKNKQTREEKGVWNECDPAMLGVVYLESVLGYVPDVNLMRELGGSEEILTTMKSLEVTDDAPIADTTGG